MKKVPVKLCLLYVLVLLLLSAAFFALCSKRISVWPLPGEGLEPQLYSDAREGGFSQVEFFESDSAVAFRAVLNSGIYHPYAGVRIPLVAGREKLSLRGVDFSFADSVAITFRASSDVALLVFTADPNVSKFGDPLSLRPLRMDIPATRHYAEHRLPLSNLRTVPVWFDIQGVEPDSAYYIDRAVAVGLESGKGALLGLPTEVEILKWEFFGEDGNVKRICLFILIFATGLFFWGLVLFYGKRNKERQFGHRK